MRHSIGLPDVHSGYGFAIGNVAAFDMGDPEAVVSPGGVGFDINCGVRLLRTNLSEEDVTAEGFAPQPSAFESGARRCVRSGVSRLGVRIPLATAPPPYEPCESFWRQLPHPMHPVSP